MWTSGESMLSELILLIPKMHIYIVVVQCRGVIVRHSHLAIKIYLSMAWWECLTRPWHWTIDVHVSFYGDVQMFKPAALPKKKNTIWHSSMTKTAIHTARWKNAKPINNSCGFTFSPQIFQITDFFYFLYEYCEKNL